MTTSGEDEITITYIATCVSGGSDCNEQMSCNTSSEDADAIEITPLTRAMGDVFNAGIPVADSDVSAVLICLEKGPYTSVLTRSSRTALSEESSLSLCSQNVFGFSP